MRISSKTRYGLSCLVYMSSHPDERVSVLHLSTRLNISKIYLEQVFSLLKRNNIVMSEKGWQGGYILTKKPDDITAFDVFNALDNATMERTANATETDIERAIAAKVYDPLDAAVEATLKAATLADMVGYATKTEYMYYV